MKKIIFCFLLSAVHIFCLAQEYDAELVNQNTTIEINRGGRLTKTIQFEIKINNREGEQYTNIAIPFSKINRISNINAHIKDSNGKIVKKLKRSQIKEESSISNFSLFEDDYIKKFTLKHNSYPYTIIYSYKVHKKEFIYISNWMPIISAQKPTKSADLTVTVPIGYDFKYVNNLVESPKIDSLENKICYKWHTSYTNLIKEEVCSPEISNLLPRVSIVPTNFKYDITGSFDNWTSYGNWHFNLMKDLYELPPNEIRKIHSITNNIEEKSEKIKALYHYLQDETRYINISIGTGGLKPFPANYVAENKHGDCKALTNYFKSLLHYLNIESYYTLVHAGTPTRKIDKNTPSQQFNHVILYIPSKEKHIWLDCTSKGPFNYLGTFTQNRNAFIIENNNSQLIKTPAFSPKDVTEIRKVNIKYGHDIAISLFQNHYRGAMFEKISQIESNFNKNDKKRILQDYFVEDGFELKDFEITKLNRDSTGIDLTYKTTSRELFKHYGNDILISNIHFLLPDFELPKNRKLPIQIDYPIHKIDTLVYEIPTGYKLNKGYKNFSDSTKFGVYKFNISESKDKITVTKRLLIKSGAYPLSEYQDFYRFYAKIMSVENKKQLVLNKEN